MQYRLKIEFQRLASVDGKNVAKYVRNDFLPIDKNILLFTRFGGGFNGGGTVFAHLYVRIINQTCQFLNISCATLFLDVVNAFASLLTAIVFDLDEGY